MTEPLDGGDPGRIGPYAVLGRLGSGGMGQVYLGRAADGQLCAVKVIHPGLAHDEHFRARFSREVAAAGRVSGPHVARVLDAAPDDPQPWLATEYVPGPSLEQAVTAQRPLPERSVRIMAATLFAALATIHANGVVHRDIKPSNILLAPDGARLIDFGIARAVEGTQITRTGMILGSPAFMSPEQANGDEVGAPSDVFSLAAVLVFASTGVGPFGEGTPAALLLRAADSTPGLGAVPAAIRPMLELCLTKDPAARPTAAVLAATLAAAVPAESSAAWLPPWVAESAPRALVAPAGGSPRAGLSRSWLIAIGVVVVVAVVAVSANTSTGGGAPATAPPIAAPTTSPAPEPVRIGIGDSVTDVAFSPDSRRAYVVHDTGLEVIDTATKGITTSIALDAPRAVAITPDGALAYVALLSGFVVVIDTATHEALTTVPVGGGPYGVAFTPDGGRAFVVNMFDSTVSVIDTRSRAVTRTLELGKSGSHGIFMRADGGQVYVRTNDDIAVISTADYTISFSIQADYFQSVALAPDSTGVYLEATPYGTVSVLDTAGNQRRTVRLERNTHLEAIAVATDGRHLFLLAASALEDDRLVVVDAFSGLTVDTLATGTYLRPRIYLAPDGRQIYIVEYMGKSVSVVDSAKYS